jgi:ribonuclease HI
MQIDPALAARLAALLKKVAHGKPLAVAAAEAGVGAHEVERIIKELDRRLWAIARGEPAEAAPDPRTKATAPAKAVAAKPRSRSVAAKGLHLVAHADGGSRGNPGEAACAAVIRDAGGAELLRRAKRLGKATNNVAEYEGVLLALSLCRELGATEVRLRLDSELVVRQIDGRYRVKHPDLQKLFQRVREEARAFSRLIVEHVPREENAQADALVNAALDGRDPD